MKIGLLVKGVFKSQNFFVLCLLLCAATAVSVQSASAGNPVPFFGGGAKSKVNSGNPCTVAYSFYIKNIAPDSVPGTNGQAWTAISYGACETKELRGPDVTVNKANPALSGDGYTQLNVYTDFSKLSKRSKAQQCVLIGNNKDSLMVNNPNPTVCYKR